MDCSDSRYALGLSKPVSGKAIGPPPILIQCCRRLQSQGIPFVYDKARHSPNTSPAQSSSCLGDGRGSFCQWQQQDWFHTAEAIRWMLTKDSSRPTRYIMLSVCFPLFLLIGFLSVYYRFYASFFFPEWRKIHSILPQIKAAAAWKQPDSSFLRRLHKTNIWICELLSLFKKEQQQVHHFALAIILWRGLGIMRQVKYFTNVVDRQNQTSPCAPRRAGSSSYCLLPAKPTSLTQI